MGEIVWVSGYVGLGFMFGDNLTLIASLLGNASGLLDGTCSDHRTWALADSRRQGEKRQTGVGLDA